MQNVVLNINTLKPRCSATLT